MGLGQRRVGPAAGVLALVVALALPPHAPADGVESVQDQPCPADWASACPSLPCSPLPPKSASPHEVMGWQSSGEWRHYLRDSAVSAVIVDSRANASAIGW